MAIKLKRLNKSKIKKGQTDKKEINKKDIASEVKNNTLRNVLIVFFLLLCITVFLDTALIIGRDFRGVVYDGVRDFRYGQYTPFSEFWNIRKFFFFGPYTYMRAKHVLLGYGSILVVSFLLSVALLWTYVTKVYNLKSMDKVDSFIFMNIPFEILLIPLIVYPMSFLFASRPIYSYFPYLIFDFLAVSLLFLIVKYIIYYNKNLWHSFFIYKLGVALFSEKFKGSYINNMALMIILFTLLWSIVIFFALRYLVYFEAMVLLQISFTFLTLTVPAIIFNSIFIKFEYIDYISNGVEYMKDGSISNKLEVRGHDQISILAENINNMSEGLEVAVSNAIKSEKMKTELITNVSHDLKTPLTSIINYVDMLKSEDIDDDTRSAYLGILDKKSKRLKTLVEEIFEASKIGRASCRERVLRLV